MPWTTPSTFSPGQIVGASDLNTNVRDNTNYLFSGRTLNNKLYSGNWTTTSTTFVDVDATNLIVTANIYSGRALVFVVASIFSGTNTTTLDVVVDGTTRAGDPTNGLVAVAAGTEYTPAICVARFTGLSSGSHTFKLQWKISAGTAQIATNAPLINMQVTEV